VGNGAIGEDEDGIDGSNVILDLCLHTFLVKVVLIKPTSVSETGCVEDVNEPWENVIHTHHVHIGILTTMPFLLVNL